MQEQRFKTPNQLFSFEQSILSFGPSYEPKPYNKKDVLFWHVEDFLEKNDKNERLVELTASEENKQKGQNGNAFRLRRLQEIDNYLNGTIYDAFDERTVNLWVNEPKRQEVIDKAEQLLVRSHYNLGYGESGLYVDYNKFFDLLDNKVPISVAERIFDNNLFLGNMATFYAIHTNDKDGFEVCENAKKAYIKTLSLMDEKGVHFVVPNEVRSYIKYEMIDNERVMVVCDNNSSGDVFCVYGPQFMYEYKIQKQKYIEKNETKMREIDGSISSKESYTKNIFRTEIQRNIDRANKDIQENKEEINKLENSSKMVLDRIRSF